MLPNGCCLKRVLRNTSIVQIIASAPENTARKGLTWWRLTSQNCDRASAFRDLVTWLTGLLPGQLVSPPSCPSALFCFHGQRGGQLVQLRQDGRYPIIRVLTRLYY